MFIEGRSQREAARVFGLNRKTVAKMCRFVEAAGGTLELRVELPGTGVLRLTGMGELNSNVG